MDLEHDPDCPDPQRCERNNLMYENFTSLATSVWLSQHLNCDEDRQHRWIFELESRWAHLTDEDKLTLFAMLITPLAEARGWVTLQEIGA